MCVIINHVYYITKINQVFLIFLVYVENMGSPGYEANQASPLAYSGLPISLIPRPPHVFQHTMIHEKNREGLVDVMDVVYDTHWNE